jgi:hypothetical protein
MNNQDIINAMDGAFVQVYTRRFALMLDEEFLYEAKNPLLRILDFCGVIESPKPQFVAELVDEKVLTRLRKKIHDSPNSFQRLENAMSAMCDVRRRRGEV